MFPRVFSPGYFTDSAWFAKKLPGIVGTNSLLEIGSGTGIVGLSCALQGAKVTSTDINPKAVENTVFNFKQYGFEDPDVHCGSMYDPVQERQSDYIFWNHPFNDVAAPVEHILFKAGFDPGYVALERYIEEAKDHLTKEGKLLLGAGSNANLKRVKEIAADNGYTLCLLEKKVLALTDNSQLDNDYRIYAFCPKTFK